jgi:hypothetical protein
LIIILKLDLYCDTLTTQLVITVGATPASPPFSEKPKPDLTEAFIILLISAAIVIFMFWIATQQLGQDTFSQLPPYISGAFKSIWTSVATGATGIGLALVKAFTRGNRPQPDYLKYIGMTTFCLLVPITVIIVASMHSGRTQVKQPPNTTTIKPDTSNTEFDIENPSIYGGPVTYILRGTFSVKDGTLTGHLNSGIVRVAAIVPPGTLEDPITRISFRTCYNDKRQPSILRQIFPITPKARDSIDVNFPIKAGAVYNVPQTDFSFELPDQKFVSAQWFCAQLTKEFGYFAAE